MSILAATITRLSIRCSPPILQLPSQTLITTLSPINTTYTHLGEWHNIRIRYHLGWDVEMEVTDYWPAKADPSQEVRIMASTSSIGERALESPSAPVQNDNDISGPVVFDLFPMTNWPFLEAHLSELLGGAEMLWLHSGTATISAGLVGIVLKLRICTS